MLPGGGSFAQLLHLAGDREVQARYENHAPCAVAHKRATARAALVHGTSLRKTLRIVKTTAWPA